MDAAAVLLIELEGLARGGRGAGRTDSQVCELCGAREFRVAKTAEERDLLWKGRKNAFGAMGRVSPSYYVQDGVVPRTQDRADLALYRRCGEKYDVPSAISFMRAMGTCTRSFFSMHVSPADLDKAHQSRRGYSGVLCFGGRIDHREHGVGMEKNGFDGTPVRSGHTRYDRTIQGPVRSGLPAESWQSVSDRTGLHGNPPAAAHGCHDALS